MREDTFYGFVGNVLLEILVSSDILVMVPLSFVNDHGKKETINYLRVTDDVADNVEVNTLQILPTKLPIICEPKSYKNKI